MVFFQRRHVIILSIVNRHVFHRRCYLGPAIVLNFSSKCLLPTPHEYLSNFHSYISDQSIEWCNLNHLNSPMGTTTVKKVIRAREEGVFLFACDGESQVKRINFLNKQFEFLRVEVREPGTTMISLALMNTRRRKTKRDRDEDDFVAPTDDFTFEKKRPCFSIVRKDDLGTRSFKSSSIALQSINNISNCSGDKVLTEVALNRSHYHCSEFSSSKLHLTNCDAIENNSLVKDLDQTVSPSTLKLNSRKMVAKMEEHEHDHIGSYGKFFGLQEAAKVKTHVKGLVEFEQRAYDKVDKVLSQRSQASSSPDNDAVRLDGENEDPISNEEDDKDADSDEDYIGEYSSEDSEEDF